MSAADEQTQDALDSIAQGYDEEDERAGWCVTEADYAALDETLKPGEKGD